MCNPGLDLGEGETYKGHYCDKWQLWLSINCGLDNIIVSKLQRGRTPFRPISTWSDTQHD